MVSRGIPLINVIIWAAIIYIIVRIIDPPEKSITALGASLAIALGFALQDILSNIFGGLIIIIDRPFQVGDKIAVSDHYGEVVQIGLRSTRIVTPDDNLVTVPNGEVMKHAISNANSGESNAMVVPEFYLPLDIDTTKAKKLAYRAAAVSRYIYLKKADQHHLYE